MSELEEEKGKVVYIHENLMPLVRLYATGPLWGPRL
jgi:hypothetical protein